ncbi:MAG: amino acid adenylation domain-containing protein [Planctomycetaceae bacterium]|jgi:amino acid adenylation domain-containing protein
MTGAHQDLPLPETRPQTPEETGPADRTIPDRFARLAQDYPHHFAVRTPDEQLTFAELDDQAARVAHWLSLELPSSPHPVGLLIGPGRDHLLALLGILQAGHWYVLLRTSQPPARLSRLVADSGLVEILTTHRHLSQAEACLPSGGRALSLEDLPASATGHGFASRATPDGLASVTYTSGSTGTPKGVMHTHRSTLCLSQAAGEANVGPGDRVVYPGSNMGVNRAILHGATSLTWNVRDRGLAGLAEWMARHDPTAWMSVPSVFRDFLRGLPDGTRLPGLRRVILTGEAVLPGDLELFSRFFPRDTFLVNELGTSETKSYLQWTYRSGDPLPGPVVPVGEPLPGRMVRLLDDAGHEVAPGEIGELVVQARAMSPGYWNLPVLTAERFPAVPGMPNQRRYHTGDLARRPTDGPIVLVGRRDHEVKVRGQRTHLGEIEAALCAQPLIQDAVVVAHPEATGEITLAAFYVPAGESTASPQDVRDALRQQLPEHMVPTFLRPLARLPYNANGKVDRNALPGLETLRSERSTRGTPPRDETERRLLAIWRRIFGTTTIGIDDDFHELGGHSLTATRIALAIEQEFGCRVGLKAVISSPTVARLAEAVRSSRRPSGAPLVPAARQQSREGRSVPASYAQRRMWFLQQACPNLPVYLLTHAWRLSGPLDLAALQTALSGVITRHDVWRGIFHQSGGQLEIRIQPPSANPLPVVDLGAVSAEQREARLRAELALCSRTPLDLHQGPLVRSQVMRLGPQEHVLVLCVHHAVFDAWSLDRFWFELNELYTAAVAGRDPRLPDLPIQYGDYAVWEQNRLQSPDFAQRLERAVQRLRGLPPLDLPADHPRPAEPRFTRGRLTLELDRQTVDRLTALGVASGATRQMVLLALVQLWLAVLSEQTDLGVAVPVAGRLRPELDPLIGLFVNTLVVRTEVHWPETFRELVRRTRHASLEAYDDEELPFDQIVEALNPRRDPGRNPLCDVLFELRTRGMQSPTLADLRAERLTGLGAHVRFDLELHFIEGTDGLFGTIDYRDELFDAAVVASWCRLLGHLATQVAAQPDLPCQQLELLTDNVRRQVLVEWNAPRVPAWTPATIHGLFERQAQRSPQAPAISTSTRDWSYATLNQRANRLAHRLMGAGVLPGDLVGVSLPHSPELVATLLAILKAGAGYLPLDRALPPARRATLLRDANPRLIIADGADPLDDAGLGIPLCAWDDADVGFPNGNPDLEVTPQDRAYVMYTSGSTGVPKGVEVTHAGVSRLVDQVDYLELGPTTRMALNAPLAFDASTLELWGPLLNGGCCVPISQSQQTHLGDLVTALDRGQVNTLWLTAALFNVLVDEFPPFPKGIPQVLVGGEALSVRHVREALARQAPGERLFNGYGPTECTTFSTVHPIEPDLPADCRSIPIGRPIPRTPVCVLDRWSRPVPPGIPGELHVGGPGLARGYLNASELTAVKFVANPVPELEVDRLYRTGDRVRWSPRGSLEFLGRNDRQVKIRGYRIELGDIEQTLAQLPGVAQAVVVVQEVSPGERHLVAYLRPIDSRSRCTVGELRAEAARLLPPAMHPADFVWIDRFPLTPTGKLDLSAFPAPAGPGTSSPRLPRDPPRRGLEGEMARLWAEVLGKPLLDRDADFFDCGGHSLAAMRLLSLVESRFGRRLPLAALYQHGTIARMARAVVDDSFRGLVTPARIRPGTHPDRTLFVLPGMYGGASLPRHIVQALVPELNVVALLPLQVDRMAEHWPDFSTMIDSYVEAIRRQQPTGPYLLAGYCLAGRLAYYVADRLVEQGELVEDVIIVDSAARRTARDNRWQVRLARPFRILANLPRWLRDDALAMTSVEWRKRLSRWLWRTTSTDREAPRLGGRAEVPPAGDDPVTPRWHRQEFADLIWRLETNAPQRMSRLRVILLRAQTRPLFSGDSHDLRWGHRCAGGVEIHELPGNHETIFSLRDGQPLIDTLNTIVPRLIQGKPKG